LKELDVILRWHKDCNWGIALFPQLIGTASAKTCTGYEQVGQHSSMDPQAVIQQTSPANAEQSGELLAELKRIGYDNLRVVKRLNKSHLEQRKDALKRFYKKAV
jgi:hypothetical protein